jgi:hypothetical protein
VAATNGRGRAAIGVRAHSGWAVVTVVAGTLDEPLVLGRSRLTIVPSDDDAYRQPYHVAASLGAARGRAVVERCAAHAEVLATQGLRAIIEQIVPRRITSCAILTARVREPFDLEKTLASHALIHAAEGLLFREAFARAAVACALDVHAFVEAELLAVAAAAWRLKPERIDRRLTDLRQVVGSPWTRDEKLATVAGLLVL